MIREDLHYTEDHEWVQVEDGVATIGITDFAQDQLGDIVYVEIDYENAEAGEPMGSIEAVKTVSDIIAPISGNIIDINHSLEDMPDQVNNDCYDTGWIARISIDNEDELANLLTAEEYKDLIS
jgi:glycine cleavage system H protein